MSFFRRTLVAASIWLACTPVQALDRPAAMTEEDLRLGVSLSAEEQADASLFCQDTLARAAEPAAHVPELCTCFARAWESRTNRLHRLVLPVTMAPNAPRSRQNLALIMRQEGGPREDRMKQLSVEYQAAARQAFRACGR